MTVDKIARKTGLKYVNEIDFTSKKIFAEVVAQNVNREENNFKNIS